MGTTITLKNVPDEIDASLKQAAEAHHRSINSEAIACLGRVLLPTCIRSEEHLARAAGIRAELEGRRFRIADIDRAIRAGRP
ncbi:MAG: Arc family DNA-binding protein [Chromatiales bacterium]|jgi:plasmid stability protein|nr:Arc family DNA-binding protein [Chromatiales bacterium]